MRIKFIIWTFLLAIGISSCEDPCAEVNSDEKCVKNTITQDLEYFIVHSDSTISNNVTLNPDDRICQTLDFGDYQWVAENPQFKFEGDFVIDPCERNPEIILSIDFLRFDFRDSLLGEFNFICQKQEHPDSLFVTDSITGSVGIEDISNNIRINGFSSDLVSLTQTGANDFEFTSVENNPNISGTYNDLTKELRFNSVLLNNIGVNEICDCVGNR
jgi:hypothetical protein